ncbi:MAG: TonB family protein [Candidatus Latescibacteria bacterium]|nr:TonB family protein [Candidatus Latescibacterota bacterium]
MSLADEARPLHRGYYRRVEVAFVLALAFHAGVFAVAPPYVPRPYRLREPPLKLVSASVVGTGEAEAPSPPAAAAPTVASRAGAFITEQLEPAASVQTPPSGPRASHPEGGGSAGSGPQSDAGEVAPPVFYAFDTPPRTTRRVVPEYPASARAHGAEGTVVLNVNIDERGRIMRVWVAQSSAPERLIQAAIDAIYQFEFSPGSEHGHPVKCTVAVPFNFSLNTSM